MARPLWSGTLSFGLVTIPIGVHTAVRDLGPHFHLLRASDRSRIKYEKVAAEDNQVVSKDDLVRGYEYEKGHYVVLSPQDFERAALHKDRMIDVVDFVNAEQIDDRYFDKPYYLTAGPGGAKAYALLREALERSGRVGIGKFVMRDRQYLAAVEPIGDALVLTTMRFQDELVDEGSLEFPDVTVREKDLSLAERLIDSLAGDWDPSKYTNEYRKNLMEVIDAKRRHAQAKLKEETEPQTAQVIDLMQRLRKSLGQHGAPTARRRSRVAHRKSPARATHATARRTKKGRRAA